VVHGYNTVHEGRHSPQIQVKGYRVGGGSEVGRNKYIEVLDVFQLQ
jgi:hypothetical protein